MWFRMGSFKENLIQDSLDAFGVLTVKSPFPLLPLAPAINKKKEDLIFQSINFFARESQ